MATDYFFGQQEISDGDMLICYDWQICSSEPSAATARGISRDSIHRLPLAAYNATVYPMSFRIEKRDAADQ